MLRNALFALVAVLALILMASCRMPDEDTTLEGTWLGETKIRVLTYTFNHDGTFSYTLKNKNDGSTVTEINGTREIEHEGYLHMYAPITTYVSKYDAVDLPRYVFIYTGDPSNKLMYFGGFGGDPNDLDESFWNEYTDNGEDTYCYEESITCDVHGLTTTTDSAKLFKFEDAENKCTVTTEDKYEYENGTYNNSRKTYTYDADGPIISGDFICYKLYNDMMIYEEEELTYEICGKYLTLGQMSQILTKE